MNILLKIFMAGILILLTSCNISPIIKPSPILTPNSLVHNPPYVHYSSPEELDIHLEFDYPDYWIFRENISYSGFIIFSLIDPRFLTLPTRDPNQPHSISHEFPSIHIWFLTPEVDVSFNFIVADYQEFCARESSWVEFVDKYKINIDEYDASVVECVIQHEFDYSSLMFTRRTIFQVENLIHVIDFEVAEHERGSEFEQGYEYFLNSIKISP